jgi:hypothetical protein
MSSVGYHESFDALISETRDMHSALDSLQEELESIDWYNKLANACKDLETKTILEHNRDEEKDHAAMVMKWLQRNDTRFYPQL